MKNNKATSHASLPFEKTISALFGFDERHVLEDNDSLSPQSLMEEMDVRNLKPDPMLAIITTLKLTPLD